MSAPYVVVTVSPFLPAPQDRLFTPEMPVASTIQTPYTTVAVEHILRFLKSDQDAYMEEDLAEAQIITAVQTALEDGDAQRTWVYTDRGWVRVDASYRSE